MSTYEVLGGRDPQIRALRAKGAILGRTGAAPAVLYGAGVRMQEDRPEETKDSSADVVGVEDTEDISDEQPARLQDAPPLVNLTEARHGAVQDKAIGRTAAHGYNPLAPKPEVVDPLAKQVHDAGVGTEIWGG